MRTFYTFILSFAMLGMMYQAQAQVTGDTSVCTGEIITYHIPPVTGASYSWSVSGGVITGATNVDSIMVNWGVPGTGNIVVTVTPPSGPPVYFSLNVTIHAKPVPHIGHAPYPGCPPEHGGQDGTGGNPDHGAKDDCEKVCKYASITYTTPLHPLSTYAWVASGALSVTGALTNTVNVTWDASGVGFLTVYETNQWGCTDSSTLCVKKMDLPVAGFTHQLNVCKNAPVQFTNTSTGATTYQWYFGDGGSSTLEHPIHTYINGGTYTITLIAISECFCTDTITSTINVSNDPGPEISCPSTLCAFDTATYSTNSAGCTYQWFAIGGTIIGPNNLQTVTVAWGAGQLGHLGLHLTGCVGVCTDTTWIDIPIVPAVGVIAGPQKVCPGDCEEFSLPLFSGATYVWKLNNGSCGQITDSSCCNKVQICWPSYVSFCNDTLTVTFFDAFLNCGGTATFIIRVRPKLSIFGQAQACSNGTSNFFAFPGIPANWTVSPTGPIITGTPGPSIIVDWNGLTGNFVITAKPINPNAVCNDSAIILVNVIAPPQAPVITGDTVSCPNNTVQYCATGNGTIKWIITGGTPASGLGNCINVTWGNTPPFTVQAYTQMPLSPYCSSDTTAQTIHTIVSIPPAVFTGSHNACANATSNYSSTSLYMPGTTFNWTLTPANSGAITSGQGSPSIQIEWGNNAPQTVVLSLTTSICGLNQTDTFQIHLNPPPTVSIVQIGTLCPGVPAQLQAVGGVFTGFQWSGPSGYTSAVNPTTITSAGLYKVTVTDAGGCTALTQLTVFNVGAPVANITATGPLQYCQGSAYSVGLCALGNGNYSYSWNNGPTTQCNFVSVPGSYLVTITDLNSGCYSVSNILSVSEIPCVPDTGTCVPAGSISFTPSSCNPKVFTNTSVNGSTFTWYFGDFTTSNQVNPTHYYNQAGFYTVTLYGYVPNAAGTDSCLLADTALIEIPLLAKFSFTSGCNGSPVCFTDQSVTTVGNSIANWNWNFGDLNTSTLQSPCHTYAGPGIYIVTLTISNPGCTTSITDTVIIAPSPVAAFSFSNINCVNTAVGFTDLSTTNINYWNWNFGNGGTSLNQNPSQSYTNSGFYPVTLIVHDSSGCYDTLVQNIYINQPIASGNITAFPDTIVCAGTTITLVAPTCTGCTYTWSTGSTNDSITVTSTGIYAVVVTDTNGCSYSTFIHVIVNQAPYAVISSLKNSLCLGEYTILSVPYNINWTYEWISNDTNVNGNTNSGVNVFPTSAGVYTFQVVITDTTTGCSDTTLAFIVTVHLPPVPPTITALGPITVCKGDTIILVGTHPDPTVSFKWSTGEINDTIKVTTNGCLTLTVTDTNGCTASAMFCVTVNPLPEVCSFWEGCYDTCSPYIIKGPPGATTYQWLFNGVPLPGDTLQNLVANIGGAYSVIVTNTFGCVDTTGILNLSLHPCPDSLCSALIVDSIFCNPENGHYFFQYHVINHSSHVISEINLQILPPNLNIAYAPNLVYVNLAPGDTSSVLTSEIYNALPGSTLCFRTHIAGYDFEGNEDFCCNSDTVCVTLPPCGHDTVCCYLHIIHDSIWCETNNEGMHQYHFSIDAESCGELNISLAGEGMLDIQNIFFVAGNMTNISGVYVPGNDSILCLSFVVNDSTHYCVDTTICFDLPPCPPPSLPCKWEYNHTICEGNTSTFQYFVFVPGTTYTWLFPGGIPSTATGMGPHTILYPTAGTYPVQLIMTNQQGSTTCIDSIKVIARPVATIVTSGTTLIAMPAGMTYQWYISPVSIANLIPGATNQFYTPTSTGKYCVVVTNSYGCSDTACSFMVITEPGCCYFHLLSDSIWCETNANGEEQYAFQLVINGCGNLQITTPNYGVLNVNNLYVLNGGITYINGTYISPFDNLLCLTFTVDNGITYCVDTTICFELPHCGPTPPCHLPQEPTISLSGSGTILVAQPAGMSYQWYTSPVSPGNLISGETNQFYTPASSGIYCVVVTNAIGCSDTVCTQFELPGGGCCYLNILSDSIWCETNANGEEQYAFQLVINGCGNLQITTPNYGVLNVNNLYVLNGGITYINGTYISPFDNLLCLTFTVDNGITYCVDTTICFELPHCGPTPPCHLPQQPTISLSGSGTILVAQPAGMSYQWYTSPVSPGNLISGATNQFYVPTSSGMYCVVVTNAIGCSDTVCTQFELPGGGCCYLNVLSDSIWCETTTNGEFLYHFNIQVQGCGILNVSSASYGTITLANTYVMNGGITNIIGTYIPANDTLLCLLFMVHDATHYCVDEVVCFDLPNCPPPSLPCQWEFNHTICQGNTATFYYPIFTPGTTYSWQFFGGIPGFATGMGPHSVLYPNPGTYPVQLTMTNQQGTVTCTDSIVVVARPLATIVISGTSLIAMPSGMTYQWYISPVSNANLISGATNQFFTPATSGKYCVVVTNSFGCSDTACSFIVITEPGCCNFHLVSDSVWCETTAAGGQQYHFQLIINGCGNMNITTPNYGALSLTNPYIMTGGLTMINGTYIPANDNMLCLMFLVNNAVSYCTDTIICFDLPPCGQTIPCHLPDPPHIYITDNLQTIFVQPSGMSYQWYNSPVTVANMIPGETNQFYTPTSSGTYCVVVTNAVGCSDTICYQFEVPYHGCCQFKYISDSIWCESTATGMTQYHFNIKTIGCGNIEIAPITNGTMNLNNPYVMQGDIIIVSGTFSTSSNYFCMLLMVHDSTSYCADTTICFNLPECPPEILPCDNLVANFNTFISGYNVNFSNASTTTNGMVIIAYSWDFGDPGSGLSNTSSLQYPTHIYSQPGTYTVCLVVVGMFPGTNIYCAQMNCQTLTVTDPYQNVCDALQAQFSLDVNGLNVYFTDQSLAGGGLVITGWNWNFGDTNSGNNNTSFLQNPIHEYSQPGYYTACLSITAMIEGLTIVCYDTLCIDINIIPFSDLGGDVTYDNPQSTAMNNVIVNLWSGSAIIGTTITNSTGHYSFDSIIPGNYHLSFSTIKPWGGVNATDALMILKHFVGISPLHGLRLLAANVDGSGSVNATDALLAARRFVGLISSFSVGDWIFEQENINIGPNSNLTVNVKALCFGDVNGSFIPSGLKTEPSLNLETDGVQLIEKKQEIILPVNIKQSSDMSALSLVLNIPDNAYEITGVQAAYDEANLSWNTVGNELRIAWYTMQPKLWKDNETILYLHLKLIDNADLSLDNCCFTLGTESTIADFTGNDISGNSLLIPKLVSTSQGFNLGQNIPNPFSGTTQISYNLPYEGHVRFVLYDVIGKEVKILQDEEMNSGMHTLTINGNELDNGVYLYRIYFSTENRKYVMTRRMVISH